MSDLAVSFGQQHASLTPIDKPKRTEIRGKLRGALDCMVWEGLPYNEAAQAVGFTVAAMRKALTRPHVLSYIKAQREVLRASLSSKNIHRLSEIRDSANNMPAVQAIRLLEQIGEETQARSIGSIAAPGLTIQIINNAGPAIGDTGLAQDAKLIDQT